MKLTEGQKGNLWLAVVWLVAAPIGWVYGLVRKVLGRPVI